MACYYPLQAYRTSSGDVIFAERGDVVRSMFLPCGQCVGCRLERSRQWGVRCMHEASLYPLNSFITLTYDDEHLPVRGMLEYPAFQKFVKRLRKEISPNKVRFFMCGEYGEKNWRPHFHACLFGFDFSDKKYWRISDSGARCYRSSALERLWPFGQSEIGAVTFESAAYCARYCIPKISGDDVLAVARYGRVDKDGFYMLPPEFCHMSLKPGIGAGWLHKFKSDVYPHDSVVVRGVESTVPKYYDKLLKRSDPDMMDRIKADRELAGLDNRWDNTEERLKVREIVAKAKSGLLYRS